MNVSVAGRVVKDNDKRAVCMSVVCRDVDWDSPRQTLCSEMLHWDEYRAERNLNDGAPPMLQLFDPGSSFAPLEHTFKESNVTCVPHSVAMHSAQVSRVEQNFCGEMQHWDDMCKERGIVTGTLTMSELFRPYYPADKSTYDSKSSTVNVIIGHSVALRHYNAAVQPFCAEMLHWDDVQRQRTGGTVLPQPCMTEMFGKS